MAKRSSVRLSDLRDVRWVLPAGGSTFRQQMERVFASSNLGLLLFRGDFSDELAEPSR
ncbi:hypothetical protein [Bradyrhizobium sp. CCBAU 51745]|uniref:hypothetical protein n=1 Tax=Bradyrhizobium sp. CCBAU 51745 TaxID=1325099 RepID=UPI003FA4A9D5